jgi:hypothetical protein
MPTIGTAILLPIFWFIAPHPQDELIDKSSLSQNGHINILINILYFS